MEELITNAGEVGPLLLAFIVINKLLDYIVEQGKAKLAESKPAPPAPPAADNELLKQVSAQSAENGSLLRHMKTQVDKLTKVVIEGNGQPGLVAQIAVLNERVAAHITDDERHSNRRSPRRRSAAAD